MDECLFCKIVNDEVPCEIVFENEYVLAFRDINPQAPTHILVIPRKHISTINELETEDAELVGEILLTARNLAKVENIDQNGNPINPNILKEEGTSESFYQGYRGSINAFYDVNAFNSFNSSFSFGGRTKP